MKQLTTKQWIHMVVAFAVILTVGACAKKKAAPPPPPPPPPPPAPTATLTAVPNTITAGQSVNLMWKTDYATDVELVGIGKVDPSGSKTVTPPISTTYRLVAKNDSGTQEATARVTVNPAPPPPPPAESANTEEQLFAQNVKDIFYDYDSYDISQQYQAVLQSNAQFLNQHPNIKFLIEGHCDERGSTEYNLALGANRATAAKQALVQSGVTPDRIRTISYGKEKPFCTESTEQCWQQNRRAHFVYQK